MLPPESRLDLPTNSARSSRMNSPKLRAGRIGRSPPPQPHQRGGSLPHEHATGHIVYLVARHRRCYCRKCDSRFLIAVKERLSIFRCMMWISFCIPKGKKISASSRSNREKDLQNTWMEDRGPP